jgi:hypothetical protein
VALRRRFGDSVLASGGCCSRGRAADPHRRCRRWGSNHARPCRWLTRLRARSSQRPRGRWRQARRCAGPAGMRRRLRQPIFKRCRGDRAPHYRKHQRGWLRALRSTPRFPCGFRRRSIETEQSAHCGQPMWEKRVGPATLPSGACASLGVRQW